MKTNERLIFPVLLVIALKLLGKCLFLSIPSSHGKIACKLKLKEATVARLQYWRYCIRPRLPARRPHAEKVFLFVGRVVDIQIQSEKETSVP